MAFDEAAYLRDVLDPARAAGGTPPADLRRRYQLREPLAAAEVTETVRQVRQCWRRSRQLLKFRKLIDVLELEHTEKYAAIFQAAADGDLAGLRAEIAEAGQRDQRRLDDLRRRLDDAAGRLRLLPPDLVAGIAKSVGVEGPRATEIAAGLGVEVREPDALPQTPPYPAYARVRDALDTLGAAHLAMFVFNGKKVRVLGAIPGVLDQVTAREQEEQRKSRGPRTASADTVCSAVRATADPASLLLYDVVARLRERVREHPNDETLLRHATEDLALDPGEAKRLIFAIRHETGTFGGPTARLRELVDAGEIQTAADFAAALPAEALTGEAAELATEIRVRLDGAVKLLDRARAERDPDQAWALLADALRRVPDLPGAEDLQDGLPPHPPTEVRARLRGETVVVTWTPSRSRSGEISYDVHRDGVPFAEADRPGVEDAGPPVNVPVVYAVSARRKHAATAPVPAAPVLHRPEPRDLRLTGGDGVVVGAWSRPPEATRVVVTRDGSPVPVSGAGFRDHAVRNGAGHEYVVSAVYRTPGGDVTTPGLRRTVTPQARPEPIADFTVEPYGDRLLIRCAPPAAGVAEFFALADAPPWPYGATVPADEVRAAGRPLAAVPADGGYVIARDRLSGVLLAVTVAGDGATVGAHREHVHLAALRRVTARRRGGAILVGLDWSPDLTEVEVRWDGRTVVVNAAAYRSQGGIRLDAPEDRAVTVEVAPTVVTHGRRVRGPGVTVALAAVTVARYQLRKAGSFRNRHLVVELTADRPVRVDRLVLVVKAGQVQPYSAEDGVVLREWAQVDAPAQLTAPLPRQRGPYWLRCFAEGAVALLDPPVRTLKSG
ncbi:hypothetical protein Acor_20580 [Acrocarpospora corrugata]|uniref:Fibronectin type-III domain-containing protein n=1 Tax=Acrocarpospora corrugata TaxID=35763 RepID=A0A5M3VT76_9ACTN|nr:hypothetical protein [Acrocarpospora corrugata]GER99994.1 hypothetical protein Acor_20580 [Acrocarpospora corrugata]